MLYTTDDCFIFFLWKSDQNIFCKVPTSEKIKLFANKIII